jgi:RNA polymerase sigma-70 factor (ECF subfamily)
VSAAKLTQDNVLIHRALHREKGGATRLFAKYQGLVLSVLNRAVKDQEQAQDLAQETFLQAFRNLARLRDVTQFKAWLMKIAQRAFLAHRRSPVSQALAQGKVLSSDACLPDIPADPEDSNPLEERLMSHELRGVVEQIPDPYRTTLVQRFYFDLPLAEVAKRQNIALPLVKYRVRHGLKLLRERLLASGMTEQDL